MSSKGILSYFFGNVFTLYKLRRSIFQRIRVQNNLLSDKNENVDISFLLVFLGHSVLPSHIRPCPFFTCISSRTFFRKNTKNNHSRTLAKNGQMEQRGIYRESMISCLEGPESAFLTVWPRVMFLRIAKKMLFM